MATPSKWPQPGSTASFSMTSGNLLFEHRVVLLSNPLALQLFPGLTPRPTGTTVPFPGLKAAAPATPFPFEAKAVRDASTETPNHTTLFQSWTKRNCGCRAQLKPTTYCASIESGAFSVP